MDPMESHCPKCGKELTRSPGAVDFICPRCNEKYSICPNCSAVNPPGLKYCKLCQTATVRVCASCKYENWAGDETCYHCGHPIDPLTLSSSRSTRSRLLSQQDQALSIKHQEAMQAEARMERFRQIERERQQELGRVQDQDKKRENQIILSIFLFTAVLIIVIIALTLLWSR